MQRLAASVDRARAGLVLGHQLRAIQTRCNDGCLGTRLGDGCLPEGALESALVVPTPQELGLAAIGSGHAYITSAVRRIAGTVVTRLTATTGLRAFAQRITQHGSRITAARAWKLTTHLAAPPLLEAFDGTRCIGRPASQKGKSEGSPAQLKVACCVLRRCLSNADCSTPYAKSSHLQLAPLRCTRPQPGDSGAVRCGRVVSDGEF